MTFGGGYHQVLAQPLRRPGPHPERLRAGHAGHPTAPGPRSPARSWRRRGAITRAWYSSRGLPDSTTAYNLRHAGDVSGAQKYTWDGTRALPLTVTAPSGEITHFAYDGNGNMTWSQLGPSSSNRYYFSYWTSGAGVGLYRSSSIPGHTERDSVNYDATLGNPVSARDRQGYYRYTDRDGLGRPRLARAQFKPGLWWYDSTQYDLADRVVRSKAWADTSGYSIATVTGHIEANTPAG
jgi:hypothetical protein